MWCQADFAHAEGFSSLAISGNLVLHSPFALSPGRRHLVAGTLGDDFAFELREGEQDIEGEAPERIRGVELLRDGYEADVILFEGLNDASEVDQRSGDAGWPQDVESYPYRELACDNPAGAPTVPRSVSTSNNNSYDWSARSTASSRRSYSRGDKRCPRTSTRCQVLFVMLLPPIRRRHAARLHFAVGRQCADQRFADDFGKRDLRRVVVPVVGPPAERGQRDREQPQQFLHYSYLKPDDALRRLYSCGFQYHEDTPEVDTQLVR